MQSDDDASERSWVISCGLVSSSIARRPARLGDARFRRWITPCDACSSRVVSSRFTCSLRSILTVDSDCERDTLREVSRGKGARRAEEASRTGRARRKGAADSEWDRLSHVTHSIAFRAATPRIDRREHQLYGRR